MGRAPDFLIAGEMKCGTTSIWELLRHHPALFFPEEKELFVLDRPELSDAEVAAYLDLFAEAGPDRLAGEATPTYLFRRSAPRHAKAIAPDARVVAIVRDPVDRAWSHYWHNVRRGRERVAFEEAIRRDAEIPDSEHAYLERGRYAESLERWAEGIGRERICLTTMDRLRADPFGVACELCAFLGVGPPPRAELPHANKASYPRWPALDRVVKRYVAAATALPGVGPAVRRLGRATRGWRTYSGTPRMSPATREELRKEYEEADARLAEWLGGPPPWRARSGDAA